MSASHIDGELVEDNNGKWLWKTANNDFIPVELMADNHLRNAAMFLMGMGYRKCIASEMQRVVWLRVFRIEWERRMLERSQEKQRRIADREYEIQKELGE